jgi:hypothetical protein
VTQGSFSPYTAAAPYNTATKGGSGYFDGSGDYLTAPSGAAVSGTGAFTVEFWVYMSATQTGSRTISGPANNITINVSSNGDVSYGLNGVNDIVNANGGSILNTWAHICVGRSAGGTARVWVNGTSIGTATDSNNYTAGTVTIGATAVPSAYLTGYFSNARITNTDVYGTSNTTITVPTAPLTAVTGTRLLLSYTNAGIPDLAMQNNLETVGNAQVSTSVKKYGTGSLAFDGTGDWLTMPSSPNLILGSGDFTIEAWLYPGSQPSAFNSIVGANSANGPIFNLRGSGTSTSISLNPFGSGDIFNVNYTFTQDTWVHVAVTRAGTSVRLFINGTQTGSTVTDSTNFTVAITSVAMADSGSQVYRGNIDDLRITKGVARYTANFTPPTAALLTY